MSQHDTFNRILASLHDAVLDDARWPATSALIDEACGMTGNALIVGEGVGSNVEIFSAGFYYRGQRRQDLERLYFETYHPWDERLPRLRQLPDSQLAHVTDLYTEQELKTSPAYNEALRQAGGQNSLNMRLDGPDGLRIVWVTADPLEWGGWGSAQTGMIERLLPHIRQFVRVRQALSDAGALGASFGELLDSSRSRVIQLERRGRIVEANDHARDMLRRGDGLFDRGGFLHARLPADNVALQRLLRRALPPFGSQGVGSSMLVRRSPGLPGLVLHLSPVVDRRPDFGARRVAALVLVVDPASRPRIDPGLVASALGLTPVESRVAALLGQGGTVREIAAAMGRGERTIRWHLGHIFSKHGLSRQADLVRLVLSLAEFPGPRR